MIQGHSTVKSRLQLEFSSYWPRQSLIPFLYFIVFLSYMQVRAPFQCFWPLTRWEEQHLNWASQITHVFGTLPQKHTPQIISLRIKGLNVDQIGELEYLKEWSLGICLWKQAVFCSDFKKKKDFNKEVGMHTENVVKYLIKESFFSHIDVFKTKRFFCSLEKTESDEAGQQHTHQLGLSRLVAGGHVVRTQTWKDGSFLFWRDLNSMVVPILF